MVEITDMNFDELVLNSDQLVVVSCFAPGCGPCKKIAPAVESASNDFNEKMLFFKINTDDYFETTDKFDITGVPALMFFKNGKLVKRQIGISSKQRLYTIIENVISKVGQ